MRCEVGGLHCFTEGLVQIDRLHFLYSVSSSLVWYGMVSSVWYIWYALVCYGILAYAVVSYGMLVYAMVYLSQFRCSHLTC